MVFCFLGVLVSCFLIFWFLGSLFFWFLVFWFVVYANAARRDAGFSNVFYCVHTFCGLSGWGGVGDVNVPWKRYVTYAGVGVGGVG